MQNRTDGDGAVHSSYIHLRADAAVRHSGTVPLEHQSLSCQIPFAEKTQDRPTLQQKRNSTPKWKNLHPLTLNSVKAFPTWMGPRPLSMSSFRVCVFPPDSVAPSLRLLREPRDPCGRAFLKARLSVSMRWHHVGFEMSESHISTWEGSMLVVSLNPASTHEGSISGHGPESWLLNCVDGFHVVCWLLSVLCLRVVSWWSRGGSGGRGPGHPGCGALLWRTQLGGVRAGAYGSPDLTLNQEQEEGHSEYELLKFVVVLFVWLRPFSSLNGGLGAGGLQVYPSPFKILGFGLHIGP